MTSDPRVFHLHLVSDSTGETVRSIARASVAQYENVEPVEHIWPLVRTKGQIDKVLGTVQDNPGVVLYTLVQRELREALEKGCRKRRVPYVAVLDPAIGLLDEFLGPKHTNRPGGQHALDAGYFNRIEAMAYVMSHDDGQQMHDLAGADVILLGASRTSKTPTSMYLANRGLMAANIPLVPGIPFPEALDDLTRPLIVGLTTSPARLLALRQNRLLSLKEGRGTDYVDVDAIKAEVTAARRLFSRHGWPVIDTTRRSIEETAAAILQLYHGREKGERGP